MKAGTRLPSEAKRIVEKVRENYRHVSSDPELLESYHRQRLAELNSLKFSPRAARATSTKKSLRTK